MLGGSSTNKTLQMNSSRTTLFARSISPQALPRPEQGETLEQSGNIVFYADCRFGSRFSTPIEPTKVGILLDLETTGLDTVSDEVVELAMAKFSYLQGGTLAGVLDTFSSLNEPSRPILEETIKLLGNTNEMAAGLKIDGDAIDAVRLVANGRLLFCLQRHDYFPRRTDATPSASNVGS